MAGSKTSCVMNAKPVQMFSTLNREGKGSKTNLSGFMAVLRIPETSRV